MRTWLKRLLTAVFLASVFGLAIGVWYAPVIFKGYPMSGLSTEVLLAKNYHQTGVFAIQNDQGVTLASNLIKAQGQPLLMSEYLGSFFLAKIFGLTGVPDYNRLFLLLAVLYALVLALFTILVWLLFGFKTASAFSLIYIFSPIGWGLMRDPGEYEFCLGFLACFFIFYFLGAKKINQSPANLNNLFFFFSGIFLALAVLSAEVALPFVLAFFIFLAVKKLKYQLGYIFAPFAIALAVFWLPSFLSGENQYISMVTNRPTKESAVFLQLHIFPDPYTYYFKKDEFLKQFANQNLGWTENLQTEKSLANFGLAKISLWGRVKVGFFILAQHATRFFSLEDFGGPLILLLWLLGWVYLKKENAFIFKLFIYWLGVSFFVFSFVVLGGRNHLMDFIWPIILGVALGLLYLLRVIKDHLQLKNKPALILGILAVGLVAYHLLLVDHVVLGRLYDDSPVPRSITYASVIKQLDIPDEAVIAVPGDFPGQEATLNYLTDKSFVVFSKATLNKLLKTGEARQALEAFGVKYILGYSDELSRQLTAQAPVIDIAGSSLAIDEAVISENKSFLMNIIR